MAGRVYPITFNAVNVTAAQDLFEITVADDKPVEIIGFQLAQTSDFGDAQDEVLGLQIIRGYTTGGSGGSTFTPGNVDPSGAAAGFTAKVNNTTVATAGTPVVLYSSGWNVRAGIIEWFPEGCQIKCNQQQTSLVLRQTVPADSITQNGTLWVREI